MAPSPLLSTVSTTSSVLSFVGVAVVLGYAVMRPKWFKNLMGRLVLALAVVDFLMACAKVIARAGPNAGTDSLLCMAQAGIIENFGLVSVFIGLAIALSMMYIVFFNGSIRFVQKFEWSIIAACFAIPLPITATMFIYTEDGEHIYGDADFWCWITSKHGTRQFSFLFVIQWAILAFVLTWIGLRRVENDLARSATTPTATGESTGSDKKYSKLMSKRMMAYTLAFIDGRIPSTANRLYPLITGTPLFELSLLQAVFSPLAGFIDCLVFLYIRYIMERGRRDSSGMGSSSEMKSTFSLKSATNSFVDSRQPMLFSNEA
ncbi:hypothetical protein HK105_209455 [Polyrhizophydium stewartii]|uniref:G-protein coupled receptors family 2 profile 2 domain-containing protein n=1 Tax=Polyrhizophydium stewartii TaxID=2732419 RepID=A0ABR4MV25_9FUNG